MTNSVNKNLQTFISLVNKADSFTLNDGPLISNGFEFSESTGQSENEVARFSESNSGFGLTYIFTEGGIEHGHFDKNGDFICEDKEGDEVKFSFFAIKKLVSNDLPIDEDLQFENISSNWTKEEKRHALENIGNTYGEELELSLKNGRVICSGMGDDCGDYVRIVDQGYELAYWVNSEWQEDPLIVMCAILAVANGVNNHSSHSNGNFITLDLNSFDDEGNVVDGLQATMTLSEVSDIVDHASQLILVSRDGGPVTDILAELEEALVCADVIEARM